MASSFYIANKTVIEAYERLLFDQTRDVWYLAGRRGGGKTIILDSITDHQRRRMGEKKQEDGYHERERADNKDSSYESYCGRHGWCACRQCADERSKYWERGEIPTYMTDPERGKICEAAIAGGASSSARSPRRI